MPNPKPISKQSKIVTNRLVKALDSKFFKALSDPTRLEILKQLLLLQRADIGSIAARCHVHRSVVSRHLAIMREAGIITMEKEGRNSFYQLNAVEFIRRFEEVTSNACALAEVCCPWACIDSE